MDITKEVELIGPGFRRLSTDGIHQGYWTPELGRWTDKDGFVQKEVLISTTYPSGVKTTGEQVNACPVLAILNSNIAENDITISWTGNTGIPTGAELSVLSGSTWVTITGFSKSSQYGVDIYKRKWVTGGDVISGSIYISGHTLPGKTWLLPNKRIYEITDINCSQQREDQPLTDIRFYALADNGSKILYALNWDKTFDDLRTILFGNFAAPTKCPTCNGSGTISGSNCIQCNEYGYSGWNSTGYLLTKKGEEFGIVEASGGFTLDEYTNKIWTKTWWMIPTKKEIKRYFAHFARLTTGEVEVTYELGDSSPTGVQSIVDIKIPYTLPLSKFSTDDAIWNEMAENIAPAGINVRFSFLVSGSLTGTFDFEDMLSAYRSGYINAVYTGQLVDPHVYGFEEAHVQHMPEPLRQRGWYQQWSAPFLWFNFISGGSDDAVSGYAMTGNTWSSGSLTGDLWMKWAQPETGLVNDTPWGTGCTAGLTQDDLWNSGVYLWDNFIANSGEQWQF